MGIRHGYASISINQRGFFFWTLQARMLIMSATLVTINQINGGKAGELRVWKIGQIVVVASCQGDRS
jgi:hypothetical protein